MKNKKIFIQLLCLGLILTSNAILAQTGNEIKFKSLNGSSKDNEKLFTVSALVNSTQPVSGNGIHFTLIVKNNSGNAISLKNIVNLLNVSLSNEKGLDIAVPNQALSDYKGNRGPAENRKWRFHSGPVVADQPSVNGRKESGDFKKQEYNQIPAGGSWKVNLIIKDVKQVSTPQGVQNRILKPTIRLEPGKYKLRLYLPLASTRQNTSAKISEVFYSPIIDVDYTR